MLHAVAWRILVSVCIKSIFHAISRSINRRDQHRFEHIFNIWQKHTHTLHELRWKQKPKQMCSRDRGCYRLNGTVANWRVQSNVCCIFHYMEIIMPNVCTNVLTLFESDTHTQHNICVIQFTTCGWSCVFFPFIWLIGIVSKMSIFLFRSQCSIWLSLCQILLCWRAFSKAIGCIRCDAMWWHKI